MDKFKEALREALNHMDNLIMNPDEAIKIEPSFEYKYLMDILKTGELPRPNSTPEKEGLFH